jgi:hypothetical protein
LKSLGWQNNWLSWPDLARPARTAPACLVANRHHISFP